MMKHGKNKGELCKEDDFLNSAYVDCFDTALPQGYLDILSKKVSEKINLPLHIVYSNILYNCVYVYAKNREQYLYCMSQNPIAQYAVNLMFDDFRLPKSMIEYIREGEEK